MLRDDAWAEAWPRLHYDDWKETLATLHMWTQIVGKIRLAQEPMLNHWWQAALYVTSRGLGTPAMSWNGTRTFEIEFDFIDHALTIQDSDGEQTAFALQAMPVADFYRKVMEHLRELAIDVPIWPMPVEVPDPIRFDRDYVHEAYDRVYAHRFWRALVQADRLCKIFRSRFIGKASPVHFFWGSFDLAVSRFSGRPAPPHPGGIPNTPDYITREAYSHEVSSAGFWPGGYGLDAMFYSYAYPEPEGFTRAHIDPSAAYYNGQMKEFMLPYDEVRKAVDRDGMVLSFFQTTYDAAANLGNWDRAALERLF